MVYIGIDLGTTYSCVSVIEDGRPVAIISEDGKYIIPSVVAFCDDEILVGNPALDCNTDMANILYVPAMFHPDQIAATKKAIELAGLKLKCLLQEPTAAAIAYNNKKKLGNSKLLVFDFGGGGQDFDSRVMKFVIDEFKKSSNYDIYKKPKLLKRLRIECRKAKESLSFMKNSINIHILVGGSTRIPEVQQKMASKFGKDKLKFDINPDEAVAYGAAIVANAIEV
ncbi:hypothetical protein WR25_26291 [Diploscapter pachys]|uniref:Uncharacterized protein n=1 Tax=Diploscapter pachys TaxID=2018661 RepID=A0A2A2JQ39_9BILA|nr:hypothetical protein WR25_26291 [Diploscapter pachys]